MTKRSSAWEEFVGSFSSGELDLGERTKEIIRTELGTPTTRRHTKDMATKIKFDLAARGQRVVDVTPELAKEWLLLNKKNRKIKAMRIGQYARDMRSGNWRFTGEAIKFNKNGDLVDGQNRLHAVIDAEATVPMLIVTGLEEDAQEVMDAGTSRTAGDALQLRGYHYSNALAASTRIHFVWQRGIIKHCMSSPNNDLMPSNAEVVQYVEEYAELATAATAAATITRTLRLPLGAIGAAYYEFLLIDADETKEFFDRVTELRTGGKGDPVNTLVKRSQEMAARREHVRASTGLFMLCRAWNANRAGEYFEKFQFGSEYRGWAPIPQPK